MTRWNQRILIAHLATHVDQVVELRGWVQFTRKSGKIRFLGFRDGSGLIQAVLVKGETPDDVFEVFGDCKQETSLCLTGQVKAGPQGLEILVHSLRILGQSENFPITPKEHGADFLLNHRHLWLRSRKQVAIARVRDRVFRAITDFLAAHEFVRVDSPILTTCVGEDPKGLFATEYFELGQAYLAQTGQLYQEAAIFAHGRTYCFGPTFRAEKSKTRRHLTEFWMLECEMAFFESQDNLDLQEDLVRNVLEEVLEDCQAELKTLERDLAPLQACLQPFVRLDYSEAVKLLQAKGQSIAWGDDLGATDETIISEEYGIPVFVTDYPKAAKAFYMKEDPQDPRRVKCADLLAPEGYGEVIGGSQREEDPAKLLARIEEEGLPQENYDWYLDLRKYGSVPHAGFGIGLERLVGWLCGLKHIREAVAFPRLMERIKP